MVALKVSGVHRESPAPTVTAIGWPGVMCWSPGGATATSSVDVRVIVIVVPPLGGISA